MNTPQIKIANILRNTARYSLLIIGVLIFIFALLSGAESQGGGVMGIIKNSPNALPWVLLLVLVYVAWKWELVGGILFTVIGLGFSPVVFLHNYNMNHSIFISLGIIAAITLPFIVVGILFISSHFIKKKQSN